MKYILLFALSFCLSAVYAVELNYNWKPNTSYRFLATERDDITLSAMGINTADKYITTVEFVLFIQSVDASGTAAGKLYLVNYSVKDSKGLPIASLALLPKDAVQSSITVDKKGHFTFQKEVTLVTTPKGNYLVYGKADENGAMAGVQNGPEKVEVYAEFDPKTGKLKAGYTTKTMNKTKPVTLTRNENSDEINVFPYDFLELMVMPEGNVSQGDHYDVKAGVYNIAINAKSVVNGVVILSESIVTDKSQDQFSGAADGQTEEGSFKMEEFGNVENMEGGWSEEDHEAMDMTKGMSPDLSGTFTCVFDATNGMFTGVSGNLTSSLDAMGVRMTVKSVLEMKKK